MTRGSERLRGSTTEGGQADAMKRCTFRSHCLDLLMMIIMDPHVTATYES